MVKKKKAKNKDHIAGTLKILKEQYDSGDLTKEEYSKAKKIAKEDKPEDLIDRIINLPFLLPIWGIIFYLIFKFLFKS